MRLTSFIALALVSCALGLTRAAAADAPPGASACSGCHPAAKGVDSPATRLIGLAPEAIATAMHAYRAGERPATVMDRIAKGFNDDEIASIAAWYGTQKD